MDVFSGIVVTPSVPPPARGMGRPSFVDDSDTELTPPAQDGERTLSAVRADKDTIEAVSAPCSAPRSLRGVVLASRYRLLEQLGRGAMGEVWRALDTTLRTEVAVKILLPMRDPGAEIALERFRFEAQVAARLAGNTPHVVAVHDIGHDPDLGPYAVMEYVRGKTLRALLLERGALQPAEVVAMLEQIAEVLSMAHGTGIAHRDLKPSNLLLLEKPGGRLHVKVADFGLAKGLRPDLSMDMPRSTANGTVLGTLSYMSPEQAQGLRVDERSDLWALAVILYEALTGHAPFRGATPTQILSHLLLRPAPPPSTVRPDLPAGLDAWFARALAREPKDRFASIERMLESFRSALNEPTPPPGQAARVAAIPLGFRPVTWGSAVLVLLAAIVSAVVMLPRPEPPARVAPASMADAAGATGARGSSSLDDGAPAAR